jgi:hypothetical protein
MTSGELAVETPPIGSAAVEPEESAEISRMKR